jgi:uncharacterized ion transporter superfamily protein YfcC
MTDAAAPAPDVAVPAPAEEKKHRFKMPGAYTILFILIVLVAISSYFIPAGVYDLTPDGAPIPGTYHEVEANPARIIRDSLRAPIEGMYGIQDDTGNVNAFNYGELYGAIDVALFVIIVGGYLGVTMKTGAITTGINSLVRSLKGREKLMIPVLMIVFALGGTSYGMAEETLAFYPLIVAVMIAAGYDALTGAAILLLGAGIGVIGSTINPFATGIASGFADTSIADGLAGRLVMLVVGTAIGIFWVMRYAERVRKDPSKSLVYNMKEENEAKFLSQDPESANAPLTGKNKIVLVLFFLGFLVMMYGVIPWSDLGLGLPTLWWWFPEMSASFILFSILIGIVGGLGEQGLTEGFVDGARDLLGVALIVGVARGISVVMNNAQITDTVLHWTEDAVSGLGGGKFLILLFLLFIPLSFLIPSSSGLATVTMPIMVPLASFAGVSSYLVVSSYQFGSGLLALVTPTFAVVMGGLAIARVPYPTWLKFALPVVVALGVVSVLILLGGYAIQD